MKNFKRAISRVVVLVSLLALGVFLAGCAEQTTYTPPEQTPTIASPAISEDGILRVGVNTASAPLAGVVSDNSEIVGIDVDIAAALADSLGLKLEVVDVGTDLEAALTSKQVDIVMGVDKSDTSVGFWTSEIYIPTSVALFSLTENAGLPTASAPSLTAAQVSSKSAWAVTNEFGQEALLATEDLEAAFGSLTAGEVSYVASDALIGTYVANSLGTDAYLVGLMQQPSGYSIGVLDSNADLKQAVSNAVVTLKGNGLISVIEMKWLGTALDFSNTPLTSGASSSNTTSSSTNSSASSTDEADSANNSSS